MTPTSLQMSQRIRVKVATEYKGIYNSLKGIAVGDFHELFFICVCLGKRFGRKEALKKSGDTFWSSTILPDEWYAYYAIYLEEHDMELSSLGSDDAILSLMQEYANGGMGYLLEDFLCDYTKRDASGVYVVDHVDGLPRELLMKLAMDWS